MRRNSMSVALAISACIAAPATRPIDELDAELLRKKLEREPKATGSVNRHTGEPHKHSREIARRLRQKARAEAGQ